MDRFQPIDVSNSSIGAHLYPSEEVLLLTPGVGLYSGPSKSLPHASGTVYLTTHRIFYIDDVQPHKRSCFIKLSIIRETQFFAGFLKSSPKITLGFRQREEDQSASLKTEALDGNANGYSEAQTSETNERRSEDWRLNATATDESSNALPTTSWVCRVCAFSNSLDPGIDKNASVRCSLCGVSTDVKDLITSGAQKTVSANTSSTGYMKGSVKSPSTTTPAPLAADGLSCPVCTFSNHPSMLRCEMCDTPLTTADAADEGQRASNPLHTSGSQTPLHRTPSKTPEPEERGALHNHVRLSFRKGGDRPFYDMLKKTLKEKRWQRGENAASHAGSGRATSSRRRFMGAQANIDGRSAAAHSDDEGMPSSSHRVGIEGILSAVGLQAREESNDMQDALRDLEALMTRAKKMVDLAESLNAKLMKQEMDTAKGPESARSNDEAANMIRSSLLRLGLPTPAITFDMARDEREYNIQLARELAGLLYASRKPLIGKGRVLASPRSDEQAFDNEALLDRSADRDGLGILPLDEVWCLWNRARGVALVSPKEMLAILPFLSRFTVPTISCKTFSSGLKVLHTPRFAEGNLSARVCSLLRNRQQAANGALLADEQVDLRQGDEQAYVGLPTLEVARSESCPLHLMDELLSDVELNRGAIVRDEHGGQVTWYLNAFLAS